MSILMPEKIVIAALAAGITNIKQDSTVVDDIFDVDVLGTAYLDNVKTYLAAQKIHIGMGYTIDDNRLPAWHILPANITPDEELVGAFVTDDDDEAVEPTNTAEISGEYHQYNLRVISASMNNDVTMFLETIARYILIQSQVWAEDNGLMELTTTATDLDPVYQFLPQHLVYRSTVLNFKGLSTWKNIYTLINDVELFFQFNPNEDFIQV